MAYRIIPRSEWGSRYSDGFRDAPLPASELWLHHSAGAEANGSGVIRSLEQTGQTSFGGGMSYTFLVTMDGSIYEGHAVWKEGAHTHGRNDIARAICLVGNFESTHPSPEMVDAVAWLTRHGYDQGWWQQPALTGGHRNAPGSSTLCPGINALNAIGEINQLAALPMEDDLPSPAEVWTHPIQNLNGENVPAQAYLQWIDKRVADVEREVVFPRRSRVVVDGEQSDYATTSGDYVTHVDAATWRTERAVYDAHNRIAGLEQKLDEVLAALAQKG